MTRAAPIAAIALSALALLVATQFVAGRRDDRSAALPTPAGEAVACGFACTTPTAVAATPTAPSLVPPIVALPPTATTAPVTPAAVVPGGAPAAAATPAPAAPTAPNAPPAPPAPPSASAPTAPAARPLATPQPPQPPQPPSSAGGCWPFDTAAGALPAQPKPVFCALQGSAPSTFANAGNSWSDSFDQPLSLTGLQPAYRTFEFNSINKAIHWQHANHWMVDVNGVDEDGPGPWSRGGAMMRPDRSFRFEGGRLVIEAEVAAGITQYDGMAWPELIVTTAPGLTEGRPDALYAYDEFSGHPTVGCRLQDNRQPICAYFRAGGLGPSEPPRGDRVFEVSYFQQSSAASVYGGDPGTDDLDGVWRLCAGTDPDTNCRDRFRWEVTKDSLRMFVNGVLYMEHSGLAPEHQLPDALVGGDVYVYFASVIFKSDATTTRFHWDRIAVNP